MSEVSNEYCPTEKSWHEDLYLEAEISLQRCRLILVWCFVLIFLLVLGFVCLLPLRQTQLVLVHHVDNGTVWFELLKKNTIPINQAQLESDLIRYVVNRESYSPSAYPHQFKLINLLSSSEVKRQYQRLQNYQNANSVVRKLGNQFIRSIKIEGLFFIKNGKVKRMAQVNFKIIDTHRASGRQRVRDSMALIAWKYQGVPKNPEARWENWDGFTVTEYSVQQQHLG